LGSRALPILRAAGLPIVRLTSATATEGSASPTQPMVRQIAPVEEAELTGVLHARSVAVLYDPSAYTAAIATQLTGALQAAGVSVPVDFRPRSPGVAPRRPARPCSPWPPPGPT